MDPADTFDKHARDTMIAGAWLGKTEVVHRICENAPAGIQDLIDCGVKFAKKSDGSWDLTREGGHSARRIFHAGDITGEKCEAAMIRKVRKSDVDSVILFSSCLQSFPASGSFQMSQLFASGEKVGLKLNIQKTKIMASGSITSWQIDGETVETMTDFILGRGRRAPESLQMMTAVMK